MANTTVNIDIQVQSKSLMALENELAGINEELKQVEIGSQAFKDLSTQAQGLTKELDKANKAAEGFTSDDKFMAADGAIKAMAGSLAGVVGALGLVGVESEVFGEFEKKAASAIAVAMGVKDISEGYKQLKQSTALATVATKMFGTTAKAALAATGIGLLVVALGTIVAYWDEITATVSGVSGEMEDQLATQEEMVAASEDQYAAISATENSLKLAGKSEREIRDLKIQQTDETITQLEAQLQTQKEVKKAQVEAAQRNKDIAQGIIRFLTLPITMILKMVDGLTAALEYIPGISDTATNLEEQFSGGIASLIFDPESVAEEGDKAIAETEKQLANLKNRRDGFILQSQNEDKAAREKAAADKAAQDQADLDAAKAKEEALAALKKEIRDAEANTIAEERAKALEDLDIYYNDLILKAEEAGLATDELKRSQQEAKLAMQAEFDQQDLDAMQAKADAIKAIEDKETADRLATKEAQVQIENAKWGLLAQAASLAKEIAGENQAVAIGAVIATQAAAIGQIVASTGLANAKAVAASPLTAGMPWVAINSVSAGLSIATAVASAAKSIQQIKASANGGGGSVSGGAPSMGGRSAGAPTQAPTNVTPQAPQFESVQPTVRSYVLSGDVTSSQEADARLNRKRTLGS